MPTATGMAAHAGNTDVGMSTISLAMIVPNTALTMSNSKKITTIKSARVRLPTTSSDKAPIDFALWRVLAQSAPMS